MVKMTANMKGIFLVIVNLALNGTLFAIVPADYKIYAVLVVNLVQVALAFIDPTYTISQLGMSESEYLGAVKKNENS